MITTKIVNPYLDEWTARLEHQRSCGRSALPRNWDGSESPDTYCLECRTHGERTGRSELVRRYSWAIPNDAALVAIAEHSPNGVVEVGAGGGYWAGVLRAYGVDVIAYDPDPVGGDESDEDGNKGWHDGTRWSEVLPGDHTRVQAHPDRTLLMVWPSCGGEWSDHAIDLFRGDTVIYVGEGDGGCTGTDRLHRLLGFDASGWHDEACGCRDTPTLFEPIADVVIPQWSGLHDRLGVYRRLGAT